MSVSRNRRKFHIGPSDGVKKYNNCRTSRSHNNLAEHFEEFSIDNLELEEDDESLDEQDEAKGFHLEENFSNYASKHPCNPSPKKHNSGLCGVNMQWDSSVRSHQMQSSDAVGVSMQWDSSVRSHQMQLEQCRGSGWGDRVEDRAPGVRRCGDGAETLGKVGDRGLMLLSPYVYVCFICKSCNLHPSKGRCKKTSTLCSVKCKKRVNVSRAWGWDYLSFQIKFLIRPISSAYLV